MDNAGATQAQVDSAVAALNSAIDAFRAAVIEEVSADINHDGRVDVGDLAVPAYYYGKDSMDADWEAPKISDVIKDQSIDISEPCLYCNQHFE